MSDSHETPPETVTPTEALPPVSKEDLAEMAMLLTSYADAQEELTQIELAKPRVLVALARLTDARKAMGLRWLAERNLPASANFEVDPDTGAFTLVP